MVIIAARTGIHGGNQHKIGREFNGRPGPRNCYHSFFHRLAQNFKDGSFEFGQFIQEQHPVLGEGNFARLRNRPAAYKPGITDRMVGRPEWPDGDKGIVAP